jgi:hypothetical protein
MFWQIVGKNPTGKNSLGKNSLGKIPPFGKAGLLATGLELLLTPVRSRY